MQAGSISYRDVGGEIFALAIRGGFEPGSLESALNVLRSSGKPAIHVSRLNGHSPKGPGIFSLPQVAEWPDLLIQLATQILARERASADLAKLSEATARLEHQASLGPYMLEMKNNLNNAITSVIVHS